MNLLHGAGEHHAPGGQPHSLRLRR